MSIELHPCSCSSSLLVLSRLAARCLLPAAEPVSLRRLSSRVALSRGTCAAAATLVSEPCLFGKVF